MVRGWWIDMVVLLEERNRGCARGNVDFRRVNRSFEKKDLISALRNKPLKKQDQKTVKNSMLYEPTHHTKQDPC